MKGKRQTSEEAIRIEAYILSEKAGHPGGMEHYFWTQAEAIVQARRTAVAVAVEAAAKPAARPKAAAAAKQAAAKPKTEAKPKLEAKPKATAKPAAEVKAPAPTKAMAKAVKKNVVNGTNGTGHQLSFDGESTAPVRNRTPKK